MLVEGQDATRKVVMKWRKDVTHALTPQYKMCNAAGYLRRTQVVLI